MTALGRHLLVEFTGCDSAALADLAGVTTAMLEAARASGATIVTHSFHHFSPHGVSGAVIIAESHLAIHTWPEHRFAAVDYFSCGAVNAGAAMQVLEAAFGATATEALSLTRGPLGRTDE
ncbi:MAG: adenosylmethionine decarboxylase [Geothrix sp.]|jgi:S-adenosylmethionine decarboxylase proenzyme|uniref:S-adenosylmethionine decarboxylase proenzyme n=1 Tax=Candidatus Geothrix odensensis TaxID=2954440 RepID=A0A936F017_9BACT|nr:adenosylmethionine decarboxylase [Holophagaceae bacterium]MBK8571693.1 adenosylmethionine decarboxylase [Candidatus Geothrix odensensis]MBK8788773.1 adenosylmethionine decarboxylase [Holophagaceae bacterium]MBP7617078.1 adenosylmethionine decarboxylase [Geothrix sp.]MCC6513572.1 adenosylmethionine decarboxylase [Geothrix sp.]